MTMTDLVVPGPVGPRDAGCSGVVEPPGLTSHDGQPFLAAASPARGLDVAEILRQLDDAGAWEDELDSIDWRQASMSELVDHIEVIHHDHLRSELPRLADLMALVAEAHGAQHPELLPLRNLFEALQRDLIAHMNEEETALFPALRGLHAALSTVGTRRDPIDIPLGLLEAEHDDAGAILAAMRGLTHDFTPPEDACPSHRALLSGLAELEADLRRHVHKENCILFPMIRAAAAVLCAGPPTPGLVPHDADAELRR